MKKILVIGGTSGLGKAVSAILSEKHEVTAVGSKDIDVRSVESCERFFETCYDVVINFAGLNYDSFIHKLSVNDEESIKNMIDVNILGAINVTSSALKRMRENNYGRIIMISSVLSNKVIVGTGVYASCKSFIDRFVQNVSAENAKYGITANSLQLGYFDGGMTYRIPENILDNIKQSIVLKRFGKIEELASTVQFIIDTEYVTGANIKIDGNA